MTELTYNIEGLKKLENLLGYFEMGVLASYRNEPHKYVIKNEGFEGSIGITENYYLELEAQNRRHESISIRFGFRTLENSEISIVVWLPDLFEKSESHIPKWAAFHIPNPLWKAESDIQFEKWVLRNLQGSSDVDNDPLYYLKDLIDLINGLALEIFGVKLFKYDLDNTLSLPHAQNTLSYQDAHKELYGYLIDGINKDCMKKMAARLNVSADIDNLKTLRSLEVIFPELKSGSDFLRSYGGLASNATSLRMGFEIQQRNTRRWKDSPMI